MNVFIINLEQCTDRLKQQETQFKKLGLTFERLPAVSIEEISTKDYERLAFNGQRPMKQSELACFLSHKKAWTAVIEANAPCLILEDDAVLVRDLKNILHDVATLKNIDVVNLEVHGRKKMISKQCVATVAQNYHLFELYQDRSGAAAYILFPSGANKLLKRLEHTYPKLADEFIWNCYSLIGYQIEPAAALQSDKAEMYQVKVPAMHSSVIGFIKNNHENNALTSSIAKIKYKKNRVVQQLSLGVHQIKGIFKFTRREIQLDNRRFNLD
ncbi:MULTISPECIES: glycosyltransferase family 25 protein [Acinetobacter]|uniref:Glycosyltransferase family 25 protein n=2 Tax=Gammaproteobacteria TaxID=1236 RepID=A0ABU6DT53_9GAMM|nr:MULTISPECIES: glycosyltransferase family 25 protein [Acinetobacter]MBF7690179.1 glycosyltransferase family 25 protein [Acinetobacter pollinis]MBF7693115.1 glycosyltransferase family 25 protein [Acinetobacter pollinis]MBF7697580.1 glycosyltransferase family 25 protein [Acinetobacter pollinis]MBF7699721.1 glycosyltransferase family 25 protein [Acinetobacter pollinis]MEB5477027.1 glycosyltransferase family 25 protein [Acinetobacter pollinis]